MNFNQISFTGFPLDRERHLARPEAFASNPDRAEASQWVPRLLNNHNC